MIKLQSFIILNISFSIHVVKLIEYLMMKIDH